MSSILRERVNKKKGFRKLFGKKSKKNKDKAQAVPSCVPEPDIKTITESVTRQKSTPYTVSHSSEKAKNLSSSESKNESLSDKEQEEATKVKRKFRFGFKLGKKNRRSSSSVKGSNLVKQETFQIEQDLLAIETKISNSENLKNMIQEDYHSKRNKYREANEQLEELRKYKEEASIQMCGFLHMYELKRTDTLKGLTKKLKDGPERIEPLCNK